MRHPGGDHGTLWKEQEHGLRDRQMIAWALSRRTNEETKRGLPIILNLGRRGSGFRCSPPSFNSTGLISHLEHLCTFLQYSTHYLRSEKEPFFETEKRLNLRDVQNYFCMFEISRLSAARQLGPPMHNLSANFGKFKLLGT